MTLGTKTERSRHVLYLDTAFATDYENAVYGKLGVDNEDLTIELNPDISTTKNVLGETTVSHGGYDVKISLDPYYHRKNDTLSTALAHIAMARQSGEAEIKTSYVEVLYEAAEDGKSEPTVVECWREDCIIGISSYGGDTTGFQIPFEITPCGNRVEGTWDRATNKFTAKSSL